MSDNKQVHLLTTKLHRPPPASDLVPRERLLERLEQSRRGPFTLVSAPAGYGKSTLVSHWLETSGLASGWISLDERDNDLRQFVSYFVAALRSALPDLGETTIAQIAGEVVPDVNALVTPLANDLSSVEGTIVLVLDDYHFIHETSVHEFVAELLQHPPRCLHLVVTTRRDPPLPLPTLRARNQMSEIRTKDLSFSLEETVAFLREVSGSSVDESTAQALSEQTEGWATAIRLTALSLRHGDTSTQILSALRSGQQYVAEYLIHEILAHQSSAIQTYLLATSVLQRFCAPLCEALVSLSFPEASGTSGQEFVERVERDNLFVVPLDSKREWFRYHHHLGELLKVQATDRLGPDDIAALHVRASEWLADNGWPDEALEHALASGHTQRAVKIVVDHRRELANREQFRRLRRWLDLLPVEEVEGEPELLLARAWMLVGFPELPELLDRIDERLSKRSTDAPPQRTLRGELDALRGFCFFDAGNGAEALSHTERALNELAPEQVSERGFALILNACAHQMVGDLEGARAAVFEALKDKATQRTTYHARVLVALCYVHWFEADASEVRQVAEEYLKLGEELSLPETIQHARYFLGIDSYDRNELERAEEHLGAVINDPRIVTLHNYVQCAFAFAATHQALGRDEESWQVAQSVTRLALDTGNVWISRMAQAFQAELALRQGHLSDAVPWASRFEPDDLGIGWRFFLPELTFIKVLIAQGTTETLDKASELLSRLEERFTSTHNRHFLIQVTALRALLHDAEGREEDARSQLTSALNLAQPSRAIRPFVDLGPDLARLLQRIVSDAGATPYIGEILDGFRGAAVGTFETGGPDQPLLEPLSKREVEILSLLAERLSNTEIGDKLFISPRTVKRHTINIYSKLGVHGRREAVAKAAALSILPKS